MISIRQTDILIAIATSRLKPSHSFTGFEVGAFTFSLHSMPRMERYPTEERRMIPFAVLAQVPDTTREFEGIDIEPTALRYLNFDATDLAANLEKLYLYQ